MPTTQTCSLDEKLELMLQGVDIFADAVAQHNTVAVTMGHNSRNVQLEQS